MASAEPRFCARSPGCGAALARQHLRAPESIAYAAHADGLKTTLTVTENLAFWAAVHGTARVPGLWSG